MRAPTRRGKFTDGSSAVLGQIARSLLNFQPRGRRYARYSPLFLAAGLRLASCRWV